MAFSHDGYQALIQDGIQHVDELSDYDEEHVKLIVSSLKRRDPPINVGIKTQRRLAVAIELVHYYVKVGRSTSAANMHWEP
eukprot:scaffold25088_cov250-Cylindrotheca_fusiformis.AAC.1